MVMMDMRYMWSEMDSPWLMPKRRHPSRLVVLRRSRRWKKGRGEDELVSGWLSRVERTVGGCQSNVVVYGGLWLHGRLTRRYVLGGSSSSHTS